MKNQFSWFDHLVAISYVLLILMAFIEDNIAASLGWGVALFWFVKYKYKRNYFKQYHISLIKEKDDGES